jgi:hypothetical protein
MRAGSLMTMVASSARARHLLYREHAPSRRKLIGIF